MENNKQSATTTQTKTINITRIYNLPLSTVWKAWSEPASLKKWWGPKNYTCPDCSIDFRVGGKFHASMQDKEGKKVWSTGTYKEIVPQKKIVCTDHFSDETGAIVNASEVGMPGEWPSDVMLTVTMNEKDGKTELQISHAGIPAEMYEDCIQGWQESLDKIEKL